jgi:Zn-finger nucleic acid-binding protein
MKCPKCKAPLEARRLAGGVEVDVCGHCYGVFYDHNEIAVPLEMSRRRNSGFYCPKDGGAMAQGDCYGGKLEVEQCEKCGGYWLDAGEIQKLRKLTGVDQVVAAPNEEGAAAQVIPPLMVAGTSSVSVAAPRPEPPEPPKPRTHKKAVVAKNAAVAKGKYQTIYKPVAPDDGAYVTNPDENVAPVMHLDGRAYKHYQTSRPVVKYALGEFNWQVQVGDKGRARDFIHPPYILSQDISADDFTWSHGEYLDPDEVWEAFKLEGHPPARHGVNPAQPNVHAEAKGVVSKWFGLFLVGACALFLALVVFAQNKTVFVRNYVYQPKAGVDASFVTPVFELKGHVSNVRVSVFTNLSNAWIFMRMALINADTDTALDFDREISYYFGRSGGESWSEGSRRDKVYLPKVKAGRYYLRVDPESKASVNYTISITRDVPRLSYLVLAVLLLGVPAFWVGWRYMAFEKQRWQESDHPWVEEE